MYPGFRKVALVSFGLLLSFACTMQSEWVTPVVTSIENPSTDGSRYPNLASDMDLNTVLVSWLVPSDTATSLQWSKFLDNNWTKPLEIASGDSFFVNWADFPSIVNWDGAPLAAHWLNRVPGGTYAYHINMSIHDSIDGWKSTFVPHTDRSATEHGFVSLLALDSDRVFALWLDGQNMASMTHGHMQPKQNSDDGKSDLSTAMTLRSVILNSDGTKSGELQVDSTVCECCQTSITKSRDNLIAVYRNRDEYETREIYKAVFNLTTGSWSEPSKLSKDGWVISGCPVNGPQIASHGDVVIATWFNAANNEPKSYAAVSKDAGLTFDEPKLLAIDNTAGRVDVSFNSSGQALLTWVASGETSDVMGLIWDEDSFLEPFTVGQIQGSRASGFPRTAGIGDEFLVMWTNAETPFQLSSVLISSK